MQPSGALSTSVKGQRIHQVQSFNQVLEVGCCQRLKRDIIVHVPEDFESLPRKTVISYFVSKNFEFDQVPENFRNEFMISEFDYKKALDRYRIEYK